MSTEKDESRVETSRAQEETSRTGAPKVLKALLPDDFGEEVAAIKRAAARLTGKHDTPADGEPVPVDQLRRPSFRKGLSTVAGLFKGAAAGALKTAPEAAAPKTPVRPGIDIDPGDEEPAAPTPPPAPREKKKGPSAGEKARETLKAGVSKVLSEQNKELGKAVASTFGGGLSEAARGVADGAHMIRESIEKRVKGSSVVFDAVETVAGSAGRLAGKAAGSIGRGLKAAGTGAGRKLRYIKDSGVIQDTGKKIGRSTAVALSGLAEKSKQTGARAGRGLKAVGVGAGQKIRDIKDSGVIQATGKKIGRSARTTLSNLAEKSKQAGERVGHGLKAAGTGAGQKIRDIKDSGAIQNTGKKIGHSAQAALSGLAEKSKEAGERVSQAAREASEKLKSGALTAGAKLAGMKQKAGEKIAGAVSAQGENGAPSALSDTVKAFARKAKADIENARSAAAEKSKQAGERLEQAAREASEKLKSGAQSAGAKLAGMKQKAGEKIAGAVSARGENGSPSALSDTVKAFARKAKADIENAGSAVGEKTRRAAEEVREKVRSAREGSALGESASRAADRLKDITGGAQGKAKDLLGKVRAKMEHFIVTDDDTHKDR